MRNMTINDFIAGRVPNKYDDDGCINEDYEAYQEFDYETEMERRREEKIDMELNK